MYGTRDAALCWEAEIADLLVDGLGFEQGRSTPCMFYLPGRNLRTTVHGDDFETLGSMKDLLWFTSKLKERWSLTDRGTLGPPEVQGTVQEIRHLNRIISWTREGVTWEPDPRHVDLVVKALGVTGKVVTPLVKEKLEELDEEDVPLADDQVKVYQSLTMRLGYLSQDRPDLQRAVRELAKGMCKPMERHWQQLKRVGRYLLSAPRVVQLIPWQKTISNFVVYCDTDHAGCIRTRKSTTGVVLMLGDAMLRSVCRGQSLIALSSGEAEYYGLVTAVSEALGEQSIAADWGIPLGITIQMDATAGLAIGSRRGHGRVKHLSTIFLWVQEFVTSGRVRIQKVHTSENIADVLTKAVGGPLLQKMMLRMRFHTTDGRHGLALQA